MKKTIGLAALACLALSDPARSVGPYVPIADRVAAAELIVAGEVIGLQGVKGPKAIHTDVTLRLAHTFKGRLSESEVTFRSLGGQVGDLVFEPEESVRYHVRDRLIVLLTRHQSRWVPLSSAGNSVVYMGANIPANRGDWHRAVNRVSGSCIGPDRSAGNRRRPIGRCSRDHLRAASGGCGDGQPWIRADQGIGLRDTGTGLDSVQRESPGHRDRGYMGRVRI